jgi:hypothetical protein
LYHLFRPSIVEILFKQTDNVRRSSVSLRVRFSLHCQLGFVHLLCECATLFPSRIRDSSVQHKLHRGGVPAVCERGGYRREGDDGYQNRETSSWSLLTRTILIKRTCVALDRHGAVFCHRSSSSHLFVYFYDGVR